MTSNASTVAIAALMDAVSLLRGEVAALARSNARIEESQEQLRRRIDVIDTGIGPLADLLPYQEHILAKTVAGHADTHEWLKALAPVLNNLIERSDADRVAASSLHQDVMRIEEIAGVGQKGTADVALGLEVIASRLDVAASANRKDRRAGVEKTMELIGFTRAAVLGQRGPLPINVEDDPLMERFILAQPADLTFQRTRPGRMAKGNRRHQRGGSRCATQEAAGPFTDRHPRITPPSVSPRSHHPSEDRRAQRRTATSADHDVGNGSISRQRLLAFPRARRALAKGRKH